MLAQSKLFCINFCSPTNLTAANVFEGTTLWHLGNVMMVIISVTLYNIEGMQ